MKGESNQKRSNGTSRDMQISNSRAMGIIVLIALLFVFQVVTFVWQKVRVAGVAGVPGSAEVSGGGGTDRTAGGGGGAGARFAFDPNTITGDSLQLLGFSAQQAQSILKYRNKGGKFRYREDFAKLYVVDSAVYAALEGYLLLPKRGVGTKKGISVPGGAENGVAGTNSAGNVPEEGKNADLSGRRTGIYGKRVEKNRYMCNLNTADSAALVKLYGIGGYYARKILRYREALGGSFADVRQLLEIEGFTQERFAGIERSIFVNDSDVKGISLLNARREFLERHPYIGPYAARGILSYIRLKGKDTFKGELHLLEQLVKERVITQNNAEKLKVYLLSL